MSPRTAIFFFLASAGLLMAILLPQTGKAQRPAGQEVACTLGACPLTVTSRDAGHSLNYPVGSEISFLFTEKPYIQCSPKDALQEMAFSPEGPDSLRVKAMHRGNCVVRSGDMSVALTVSRFR